MDVEKFSGRMLHTGLRSDYRFWLWVPTSASRAISAVAEHVVILAAERLLKLFQNYFGDIEHVEKYL